VRLGPPPAPPPVGAEHVDLVRALRRLPLAQREVLVLHYVAELAVERVAAELRVPVGTVKSRLARGRAALAQQLQADVGAPEGESTNA
jgi:RNA polymerase sigma-70 factor, ECF subfamily